MRGVDGERGEHREDAVVELARELGACVLVEVVPVAELDARLLQARCHLLGEHGRLQRDQLLDAGPDRAQLLDLVHALLRGRPDPGFELLLQPGDAYLEELVEVGAEDREELRALEQRQRGVLRERQHASVELEPRELAVEVAGRAGRGVVDVRVHPRMVGGIGGRGTRPSPGAMKP